ncbi:putative DNA-binding domain-containing protein [Pseudomonas sp. TWP3-1]|uniref:HvfC/BufC family peptide modification chaperone n=1 Tax=Pseudomonas sp. TWP3-1 TaxID=2804631 RepID=UPI003CF8ADDA
MSNQADFAAALIDIRLPCPEGLCSANGADPASRFAVYRNNVQSSLIDALADCYPVVGQLVGEEFFRAMVGVFVQSNPPRSALMSNYGEGFAQFINEFEPASSVPYLADIARLERLRTVAYHAADAAPLSQSQIATTFADPLLLNDLCIGLHSSLHLLDSAFAVVDVWAAHQKEATLAGIDLSCPQTALVLRYGLEVEVFALDHAAGQFIQNLRLGQPLMQALESVEAFDLSQTLALLITHSAITHLHHKVSP